MFDEPTTDRARPGQIIAVLRRRVWIIVPCVVIAGIGAFLRSHSETKKYSSRAALLFQENNLSQQLFGYQTSSLTDPTTQAATNLNLVTQPVVATYAARVLGIPSGRVSSEISVSAAGQSNIVNVTATDPSPTFATRLANAYAAQFVSYRQRADRAQVQQAAAQLRSQIQLLRSNRSAPPAQLRNLETRLSQLDTLIALQTGNVQQAQQAQVPSSPSSPHVKRDTAVGLLLGLLVGLLAAFIAERIDQTLRDPDEIKDLIGLPLLGAIPGSRALARGSAAVPFAGGAAEAETFHLLRTQLRYFNVDREIKSVLIVSAAPRDGKSTIAWNLARAAATSSRDAKAIIVDADLRKPVVAQTAGLPPGPGLAEVLTQDLDIEDVVRSIPIKRADGETAGELDVLTAGSGVPNPTELMESYALRELIADLHARYDFIVFDAPPTSVVSDAIPLMTQVSGVLLVVRLRQTRRADLRRLREQIADLKAHVLGLVLNDLNAKDASYGYGYGYGYGTQTTANGTRPAPAAEKATESS